MALNEFVLTDATYTEIFDDLITQWETSTGETLLDPCPERHLLSALAHVLSHMNALINQTARELTLTFATSDQLDYLGDNIGVERLSPSFATVTIGVTLETPLVSDYTLPAGVRVQTRDGAYIFATDEAKDLKEGDTYFEVAATAQTSGAGANDYSAGEVNTLLDTIALDVLNNADWSSTESTSGGAATEGDEYYRTRIRRGTEKWAAAGSIASYKYYTASTSSSIADVSVYLSDDGNTVYVRFINKNGAVPSAAQVIDVEELLNSDEIKPLTDVIDVDVASQTAFDIILSFDYYSEYEQQVGNIADNIEDALTEYGNGLSEQIGADIIINKIRAIAMGVEGVADVSITSPAANVAINNTKVAYLGVVTVNTGDEV